MEISRRRRPVSSIFLYVSTGDRNDVDTILIERLTIIRDSGREEEWDIAPENQTGNRMRNFVSHPASFVLHDRL